MRAWRGAVTPPIVTVTATGPAAVAMVSSRTPASSRSAATANSSAVQAVRMTPNLLPEKRPRKSLPRRRARMRLATQTDALTGLPNRRWLAKYLPQELTRAERPLTEVSVIVIDVDGFKTINDTYGHDIGDQALREASARG